MTAIVAPELEDYCRAHTSAADPLLEERATHTRAHCRSPQMLTGPIAGTLLRRLLQFSPHGGKIRLLRRRAIRTLKTLAAEPPFDSAFLDADKESCIDYDDAQLPRLRPGGRSRPTIHCGSAGCSIRGKNPTTRSWPSTTTWRATRASSRYCSACATGLC